MIGFASLNLIVLVILFTLYTGNLFQMNKTELTKYITSSQHVEGYYCNESRFRQAQLVRQAQPDRSGVFLR